ncbi:MAG: glutamine synthetase, partial [Candidatus Neomarinimicrobiota bacterium]|nr:glutamine synthetase [Candidatus Neomarinimicrobiota bacterium]
YGADNEQRLTGLHETCSINEFRYGVSDRGASIRIPMDVDKDGKGYLEDRRPASNVDPYKACAALIETTCS